MSGMLLAEVAAASGEIAATRARTAKTEAVARLLRATAPQEAPVVIAYLGGRLPQRRTGLGWRALSVRPAPAAAPTLTVAGVDAALTAIAGVSGSGSAAERRRLLDALLRDATADEQDFLVRLIGGELRQGALEAIAVDGLARAADAPPEAVRRAVMLRGSPGPVARAVLAEGPAALAGFRLRVGRPVQPMLAQTAGDLDEAVDRLGPCAVEEKLDGIRVQVHRDGDQVSVYSRTLEDMTARLPEVVDAAREPGADRLILDGEVIALGDDGRPHAFQDTSARAATARGGGPPLSPVFFDLLAVDGRELLDLPDEARHAELARITPASRRVRRLAVPDPGDDAARSAAREFLAATLGRGHEGVMVKALDAPYSAGRRGASWLKVKPVHTLDLVVLAAEWGHGRRTGRLSNLHLGARDPAGDGFLMLGKTFKGLTDAVLAWQTARLRELAVADDGHLVTVRPELVVEVAFDGLQRSTRYPAGVTLRFARVVRYRPDKPASQADTLDTVLGYRR